MTTANTNNRASLLAGLRTGGVRSSTLEPPHTASPAGTFNLRSHPTSFSEEDDEIFHQNISQDRDVASVDGSINGFSHHQAAHGMNPNNIPFSPGFGPNMAPQAQIQMQMLQLEMMRIQAMQAQQQYQEIIAQATLQQHLQTQGRERRISLGFNPPATAGPMTSSFDLRAATLSAQMRRANQTDQIKSQLSVPAPSDDYIPMTTTLGGRFGRTISGSLHAPNFEHPELPLTPNSTTVISGGTFLGHPTSNTPSPQVATPSKSDSASSWRRSGNNSVLGANRTVSSPSLKVTPPPNDEEHLSPFFSAGGSPASLGGLKIRPQPLRFSPAVSQSLPTVAIDTDDDADSSGSSEKSILSNSSATSPHSSASNEMPLSPREEASKRLYEGLGIGRPVSSTPSDGGYPYLTVSVGPGRRMVSQPTRQPRGPPSGDELGPKNFATRIRRKAIGGLGVLMGARERREVVEAY